MNIDKVKFGLRKITTQQFATFDSVKVEDKTIAINLNFGFGINDKHRILGCSARFNFLAKEESFMVLDVKCDFEIEEEAWNHFIDQDADTIVFPKGFVQHLGVITIGTSRGILHSKTENTEYFIPTLDVTASLKEDIRIKLKV